MNDSESSDEDTEGYTTTKALLGFASKEPTDDSFSQLGGRPVSAECWRLHDEIYYLQTRRHGSIRRVVQMPSW